jgi:polar amino acid transport system substrate-binding protein
MRSRFLVLICASFSVTAHAQTETLRLVTHSFPPYSFVDPQTKSEVGISTDKIVEMMHRAGLNYTVEQTSWTRAYQLAMHETATCVFTMIRSPERENLFEWIGPIYQDEWVFFGRSSDTRVFKNLEDLRPYRMGSYKSSQSGIELQEAGYKVEFANDNADNFRLLINGRIDYWMTAETFGDYIAQTQGGSDQIRRIFKYKKEELYLACHPGLEKQKVERLNAILLEMNKDGSSEKILRKYLPK